MSVVLIFMAGIAGIVIWWASHQRLTSKPWLEAGLAGDAQAPRRQPAAAAKVGLGIFLAVVGSLFALLISAYIDRMDSVDWWAIPVPRLLWVNTALLASSSAALQWAQVEARQARAERVNTALEAALVTALLFLAGQVVAWRQLVADGYVLADNPANSFFYMITGLHGLHIAGGILVLGRTMLRARSGVRWERTTESIELCAIYWHFMLAVWLVLFALLTGWANDFAALCRQLVT